MEDQEPVKTEQISDEMREIVREKQNGGLKKNTDTVYDDNDEDDDLDLYGDVMEG